MAKIQPAVTRLWFHINPGNNYNYLDISAAVSAANRRFYRQGMSWAVAGMSLHTADGTTGDFDVSKVPDTWMAQQAYKKSKMLWMKSQDQVLEDQPTVAARYRDFKVYLDNDMTSTFQAVDSENGATDTVNLLPVDRIDQIAKPGEWIYSELQIPVDGGSSDPLQRNFMFVGNDTGSLLGMIHGYGLSRTRPNSIDPNTPAAGGWMNQVFDVADNLGEIRQDISDNNDVPPYRIGSEVDPEEYYPGGKNNQTEAALHAVGFVTGSTVGGKTRIEGGVFHCGLIRFDWNLTNGGDSMHLAVDLVPGPSKGYLTEAY
ncbi:MAG: hypothetical protein [Circular genetic element sp.]|nr:MAG: hypothetical protein [Circular genetic element sp.]